MTPPTVQPPLRDPHHSVDVRTLVLAFAVVTAVLLGVAYVLQRYNFRAIEQAAGRTMTATARAQSQLIRYTLNERLMDARLFSIRPAVWRSVNPLLAAGNAGAARRNLALAIAQTRESYGYKMIAVFDTAMRPIYPGDYALSADERRVLRKSLTARAAAILPFQLDAAGGPEFGISYPIYADGDSTKRTVGTVLTKRDATIALLPMLTQLEGEARGAESVILQRLGDSITVVAATRSGGTLVPLHVHMARQDTTHVPGLLERYGADSVVKGLDYRGVPVLAAGRLIAATPWLVVAKVELETLHEEQRTVAILIWAAAVGLILLTGLTLRLFWFAADRRAEQRQFVLASQLLTATTTSMDGIIIIAPDGRVLDANPSLAGMTGFTQTELLRLTLTDLMQSVPADEVLDWIAELIRRESAHFHSQWRRKDGPVIEVDISSSHLPGAGEGQLFCFVRDVTAQIETTRRLSRLNALYAFLNRASEALFAARSAQAAYDFVVRSALDDGRFRLCWIGEVDEAAGIVRPVAWAGAAAEYVPRLHITTDPALPTSQGPTGVCVAEARTVLANDFAGDPRTAPWHALAEEHGLGASAALPVIVDGRVVAAVMFYATDRGFFEPELVSTLSEVARLLGLVLQSVAAEQRRHEEEERRRISEERFRRLFESSPLPMYVLHESSGLITRVNRAFIERFGYTTDDLPDLDTQFARFYPDPVYRTAVVGIWQAETGRASTSDSPLQLPVLRICCWDGTYRDAQGFVSRAGDELVVGWVDLTEQRAMQATLQQAEEIAKLGSYSHDLTTNEIRTSPDFLDVLGFDARVRDETPDPSAPWLLNLFHPDDSAQMLAAFLHLRDVDQVVRAAAGAGPQRYLHVRTVIEHDSAGHALRAVGSIQDVTAEVTATNELRRLRDHLQDLVDERTAELAKANAILQATDRRLKAMLAMSQKAATLDESAILQLGVDEAARLTASPVGFLHLISEDQQHVEFGFWADGTVAQCECLYESRYAVADAQTWRTMVRDRQPVLINAVEMSALAACPPGHVPLHRLLAVPVVEGDRVRAVVAVGNKEADYDASDMQELRLIGHDIWSVLSRRRADLALERAYERVKASDQRFAFAMEASSEGVWEWDIVHELFRFNDPYATMLGFSPEEMPHEFAAWATLLHPDERDAVLAAKQAATLHDAPYANEFRMRSRDGSYRWILSRGRVVQRDGDGVALRVVGTHTDLTARRQAEDELRNAKEAADAASRAKSAFLATMSHEIRTPLNGVIAMAEILGQSDLPPHDMDAVQTIQTSARALMAVIDDILDFSKIEAGRLEIELADVSIVQLTEDLAESMLSFAHLRDVDLMLFVEPEVPMRVRGDPTRLRQIMYNLVGNAIKFSAGQPGRRGRVAVRVGRVAGTESRFYCEVTDNGIGMTQETISQLFTSFKQAEASTTRKFGGTGLGLAITKRLVDLMDGTIAVTSAPGAGSSFRVDVPLPITEKTPALVPHNLEGLTCLVVPHDGGIPSGDLRRLLEFANATVVVVADEQAAATAAGDTDGPCVVIHDLNGTRVLQTLHLFEDRPNVRHVALTRGRRRAERINVPNLVSLDMELLRGRRLIRAVAVAAGRASPEIYREPDSGEPTPVPPHQAAPVHLTVEEARAAGRLILVAEDDSTNQKVILQQLHLLGHTAEIVSNGAEALAKWRAGPRYALLLSDLHMPELDGYALTQAIRGEERIGEHLPIVALTANALRGEGARANVVGMDGYLTKPVPLKALRELVNRYVTPRDVTRVSRDVNLDLASSAAAATPSVPATSASMTPESQFTPGEVRRAVLANLVGDDEQVIREFLADFQLSARTLAADIRAAHEAGNLVQVGALAHRLKSSARSVGALLLGELCAELERAGKLGQAALVDDARRQFDAELALVDAELNRQLSDG